MSDPTIDELIIELKEQGFTTEQAYDLIISLRQMLNGEGEVIRVKREEFE